MSGSDHNQLPASQAGSDSPGELGEPPAPVDFALRILQRVGIPRDRYDTYVRLDTAAGGLFVAFTPKLVTGAVLATGGLTAERFEELHRSRTGRSAIPTGTPLPGLVTALRTGRARTLSLDFGPVDPVGARVLRAVQAIPARQLRPLSWLAREASLPPAQGADTVLSVLAHNPFVVLVPCHRVTYEHGAPCDAAYLPAAGDALRSAEGIDMAEVHRWSRSGAVFLGSDTTQIYCHPTCAHARRITPAHRVPFPNAREARRAGYRACKSCRPVAA